MAGSSLDLVRKKSLDPGHPLSTYAMLAKHNQDAGVREILTHFADEIFATAGTEIASLNTLTAISGYVVPHSINSPRGEIFIDLVQGARANNRLGELRSAAENSSYEVRSEIHALMKR